MEHNIIEKIQIKKKKKEVLSTYKYINNAKKKLNYDNNHMIHIMSHEFINYFYFKVLYKILNQYFYYSLSQY